MSVLSYISSLKKYQNVIDSITNDNVNNIYIGNSSANISKMLAILSFQKQHKTMIYVCENIFEASNAYAIISDYLKEEAAFYPVEEIVSSELVASSPAFRLARIETINDILNNKQRLIVTTPEGLTHLVMSKDKLKQSIIHLHVGDTYPLKKLVNALYERGYKKVSITESTGNYSVRGSIIDVFPLNETSMFRINYFDDEIESIKKVDIETQRSIEHLDENCIYPLYEIFYNESEIDKIYEKIITEFPFCERLRGIKAKLLSFEGLDQMQIITPFIDEFAQTIVDLLEKPTIFLEKPNNIFDHERKSTLELENYVKNIGVNLQKGYFLPIIERIKGSKKVLLCQNVQGIYDIKLDLLIDFKTINTFNYNNNLKALCEDIKVNSCSNTYIITHTDDKKVELLYEIFDRNNILYNNNGDVKHNCVNVIIDPIAVGFNDYEHHLICITPNEFASGKVSKSSRFSKYYQNSTKVYNKDDIRPGDYVIHQNYGIGIYRGIETRQFNGHLVDYLYIQYDKEAKLYVPVESIYLLEKYNISGDELPKLDNFSTNSWAKRKKQVQEKVNELAKDLVRLQAKRLLKEGFEYNKDTVDQQAFEEDFEYIETLDQLNAIKEVKADMESNHPMDRLICGDVGFGKTEVAMRAAFKAVESGKQVAYLAPTTVLSRQHYYSFKERFEKYGVRVELLNRFVLKKDQKIVLEGLKTGYVDIVIGTHRILSSDIEFNNLGLLIVDEEQRFGVKHKERIKQIKENVDILTLTATPIPRTLQMSLSGLKDLSLIETPPVNRLPVQTYVLESNDSVIREAINKELSRNGQVFYLLNRIDELDHIVSKVHTLCPHAKIGVIHGQMDKDSIESELINFLDGSYNVLVCTTIIETGIDIPNANTIIIEKAYLLGLSQLYQIRGRVGRSERISYAYLMYEPGKVLTSEASSRLEAIKEFTELGSGYKIALRDLAIRGAGDILGKEQSGFISSVGLELYSSMLQSAINELNGVVEKEKDDISFKVSIDKHIDDSLVADDDIKISIHKEINKIKSREQINELVNEYTDRFGQLDQSIYIYMEAKYLEFLLKSKGVSSFKEDNDGHVYVVFDYETTKKLIFNEIEEIHKDLNPLFEYSFDRSNFTIIIDPTKYDDSYIFVLTKFLERIVLH